MEPEIQNSRVIFLLGQSGAGCSVAIRAFEDLGYRIVDHLPIALIPSTVNHYVAGHKSKRLAIGIDSESFEDANELSELKKDMPDNVDVEFLFLKCGVETLVNRFSETRRKHPKHGASGDLQALVLSELEHLKPVQKLCSNIIDTTYTSSHQLNRVIEHKFATSESSRTLFTTISSFGFKYGVPRDIDMVYDVRFLSNPHYEQNLRLLTGLDENVSAFVFKDGRANTMLEHIFSTLKFSLPEYYKEGKHYFRVGIGCTGGQHRSVAMAEKVAAKLFNENIDHTTISVFHRDIQLNRK